MLKRKQKYLPARSIFVDIDNTLHLKGVLNERLVDWCRGRKNKGFKMVLWSSRGEEYAQAFAERHDLLSVFDLIIGKPGYIVDDMGWSWIKYTRVIDFSNALIDGQN